MGLVQIDGKLFTKPVYVGDPGAKGAQPDDKVVIEMVRFPSHVRDGEGVIIEILGQRGQPGVDTLSIIHEFNLPGEFAEEALEDARRQAELFDEGDRPTTAKTSPPKRSSRSTRRRPAISTTPSPSSGSTTAIGRWACTLPMFRTSSSPRSPLDREARDRATSVYLPDQVIPMLPEIISNNLASLQPDKVRYAITARIEFTAEGLRDRDRVFKSAIKSCRRFTYEEVDEFSGRSHRAGSRNSLRTSTPCWGGCTSWR